MPQTYIKQRGALGTAVFSPDKKYRYVLTRGNPRMRRAVWVMLNPSQADQHKNDHTITKCVEFSRRWGFPGIFVVNLYALVSTDPSVLLTSPDPIGLMNDAWLRRAKQYASAYDVPVMAAWGNNVHAIERTQFVSSLFDEMYCLGVTNAGQPKHPLRLAYDTPIQRWS